MRVILAMAAAGSLLAAFAAGTAFADAHPLPGPACPVDTVTPPVHRRYLPPLPRCDVGACPSRQQLSWK